MNHNHNRQDPTRTGPVGYREVPTVVFRHPRDERVLVMVTSEGEFYLAKRVKDELIWREVDLPLPEAA
jgi:hypothetical protein